jgi:hypothetical protein
MRASVAGTAFFIQADVFRQYQTPSRIVCVRQRASYASVLVPEFWRLNNSAVPYLKTRISVRTFLLPLVLA